jgi:hypothetical protein
MRAELHPFQKEQSYPIHIANRQQMPGESVIRHEVLTTLHIQDKQ